MIIPNPPYGENIWERVDRWTPADLNVFTGTYASDEAETVLNIAVDNGRLAIHRRPSSAFSLTPTYHDAFD